MNIQQAMNELCVNGGKYFSTNFIKRKCLKYENGTNSGLFFPSIQEGKGIWDVPLFPLATYLYCKQQGIRSLFLVLLMWQPIQQSWGARGRTLHRAGTRFFLTLSKGKPGGRLQLRTTIYPLSCSQGRKTIHCPVHRAACKMTGSPYSIRAWLKYSMYDIGQYSRDDFWKENLTKLPQSSSPSALT